MIQPYIELYVSIFSSIYFIGDMYTSLYIDPVEVAHELARYCFV